MTGSGWRSASTGWQRVAAGHDPERAVTLRAAAHANRAAAGVVPSGESAAQATALQRLRERLGKAAFEAAWAVGKQAPVRDLITPGDAPSPPSR